MGYPVNTIAQAIDAELIGDGIGTISHILTDSRKLLFPETTLFFALSTKAQSGKKFIADLYQKGVRSFVVDEIITDRSNYSAANFLLVKNVLTALQSLAAYHRSQFSLEVIGITGSNGKTIVKEWLNQCLENKMQVVRSPKSYNSQVGVPLSVWEINSNHHLGIFEAGISEKGEMERLQKIIQPNMGIYTFHGLAHAEGFANETEKIQEKLQLFTNAKALIYCSDDNLLHEQMLIFKQNNNGLQLFPWGKKEDAYLKIVLQKSDAEHTVINFRVNGKNYESTVHFTDQASLSNLFTTITTLFYLGVNPQELLNCIQHLKPVEMRLELLQGLHNCTIINDAYSADINSLNIALDFLGQQNQHVNRSLILSDLPQTIGNEESQYRQLANIINQKKIFRLVGIGENLKKYQQFFNAEEKHFFTSTNSFLQHLHQLRFRNETILVKGARVYEFEKIVSALVQKTHQTVLEVNLTAMRHNLAAYRAKLSEGVRLMSMVKAFSYGAGSFEVANVLQHAGADYLAVAYTDEAVELRRAGISLPIMVMNIDEFNFDSIVQHNLEPELFSFSILHDFKQYLQKQNLHHYPIHLKLDTGMHRLGFEEKDLALLIEQLKEGDRFKIQSVFSHLVASDDATQDEFTHHQARLFSKMASEIQQVFDYPILKHICNTGAISRFPQYQFDMVRLGIGFYGVDSNAGMQSELKTVATLKTTIAQIKNVKAGDTVGYSRRGKLHQDSVIATVRIGYADGYRRNLGNGVGKMLVNGQLAPTIGNVCMDMTMLDITGIVAQEEDEVIVFGEMLSVKEVATQAQTISYEILTSVSQRVNRMYFEE